MRNVYSMFVGNPEGKRSLGKPQYRWRDNVKMDLRQIILVFVDWVDVAQDRDW
jgi:hypothetical protein